MFCGGLLGLRCWSNPWGDHGGQLAHGDWIDDQRHTAITEDGGTGHALLVPEGVAQ
jgi:hypothetical protein